MRGVRTSSFIGRVSILCTDDNLSFRFREWSTLPTAVGMEFDV